MSDKLKISWDDLNQGKDQEKSTSNLITDHPDSIGIKNSFTEVCSTASSNTDTGGKLFLEAKAQYDTTPVPADWKDAVIPTPFFEEDKRLQAYIHGNSSRKSIAWAAISWAVSIAVIVVLILSYDWSLRRILVPKKSGSAVKLDLFPSQISPDITPLGQKQKISQYNSLIQAQRYAEAGDMLQTISTEDTFNSYGKNFQYTVLSNGIRGLCVADQSIKLKKASELFERLKALDLTRMMYSDWYVGVLAKYRHVGQDQLQRECAIELYPLLNHVRANFKGEMESDPKFLLVYARVLLASFNGIDLQADPKQEEPGLPDSVHLYPKRWDILEDILSRLLDSGESNSSDVNQICLAKWNLIHENAGFNPGWNYEFKIGSYVYGEENVENNIMIYEKRMLDVNNNQ